MHEVKLNSISYDRLDTIAVCRSLRQPLILTTLTIELCISRWWTWTEFGMIHFIQLRNMYPVLETCMLFPACLCMIYEQVCRQNVSVHVYMQRSGLERRGVGYAHFTLISVGCQGLYFKLWMMLLTVPLSHAWCRAIVIALNDPQTEMKLMFFMGSVDFA